MGGFAIAARVALLWQHNANPSYKLASIPRYDDIVRTAGWAGSARAADWLATAGAPKIARRIQEAGAAGPTPTGAFSTLLQESGLWASTDGELATKSERKMLASTGLYSLYAWFILVEIICDCASLKGMEIYRKLNVTMLTRMWANAQPDGRPAEHRWRPLFNAAKFG